jgi:hypothetical protein
VGEVGLKCWHGTKSNQARTPNEKTIAVRVAFQHHESGFKVKPRITWETRSRHLGTKAGNTGILRLSSHFTMFPTSNPAFIRFRAKLKLNKFKPGR